MGWIYCYNRKFFWVLHTPSLHDKMIFIILSSFYSHFFHIRRRNVNFWIIHIHYVNLKKLQCRRNNCRKQNICGESTSFHLFIWNVSSSRTDQHHIKEYNKKIQVIKNEQRWIIAKEEVAYCFLLSECPKIS